jgi:hypothetical protein
MLKFPVDPDLQPPPAFNAFLAACEPSIPPIGKGSIFDPPSRQSLVYPSSYPFALSLDLATHPVLDTIRTILFPNMQQGQHLTAVRDRLEVFGSGQYYRMHQECDPRTSEAVGTIIVTLPVRFNGGSLVVRKGGLAEKLACKASNPQEVEWCAFTSDCEHEIRQVKQGYRMWAAFLSALVCRSPLTLLARLSRNLTYNLYMRSYGPAGTSSNPLVNPQDGLLDALVGVLNHARGTRLGFYLSHDYGKPARTPWQL